jgi:putative endonuclease
MAAVYILYSKSRNNYYVGSCLNLDERLEEHKTKKYADSFTTIADDWELFYCIGDLEYKQARNIENHIKKMKSRTYIDNLKKYQEISIKLKNRFK